MHAKGIQLEELHDLLEALTAHKEGSCREINFALPTWEGVDNFVASLAESYGKTTAVDHEGREFSGAVSSHLASGDGSVHFVFANGTLVFRRLQLFVGMEEDGSPFVEVTFFPEDVVQTQALKKQFVDWAVDACRELQASRFYARYENASW